MNTLLFLAVLVVLILVHELGHFLAARVVGIRVDEFGLGFPPRLWSKKRGDTIYSLNALPLGGFVRLAGEFGTGQKPEPGSFMAASVWRRIFVVCAGVLMNLALAVVLLWGGLMKGLPPITQDLSTYPGAVVNEKAVEVRGVVDNSAAAKAGLQAGDILLSATDQATFSDLADFQSYTKNKAGQTVEIQLDRQGSQITLPVTLGSGDAPLGVEITSDWQVRLPFWSAGRGAFVEVWGMISGIGRTLWSLVSAPRNNPIVDDLSGPIGIYQATTAAAQMGFEAVLVIVVLLSVNLAVINILPIPALDGGRLLFLLIEAVARRRVVREEFEAAASSIGFVLLIGLLVLLTARDILRW